MKRIIFSSLLIAAVSFTFTSCLKDKGFDNYEYGINDPDTQAPGVGFSFGANAKNDYGLDVKSTPQVVNGLTNVNMLTGVVPSNDVNVTLTNNTTTMLAAYNSANGTAILALPTALYTVPATLVVPAGSRFNDAPITVSNTTTLDPNKQYAVGLTISAVDGGYNIAGNMKNLFIIFGVKNQYDGTYTLNGMFHHPVGANPPANFTGTVQMHTSGPNSVKMYVPLFGGYYSLMIYGGGLNAFGSQEPNFTVNQVTNKVTVQNVAAGATTFYDMGLGFNNAGYDSRWDPSTKTMYACWGYNLGAGGTFGGNGSAARLWLDTLIRTGPR